MNVVTALRNSKKGQLKYDRYWEQEGRTQEILDEISASITRLTVSPKALALVIAADVSNLERQVEVDKKKTLPKTPVKEKQTETKAGDKVDLHLYKLQSLTELPILEYEEERLKSVQEIFEVKKAEYENHSKELQQQIEQQYQILKRKQELEAKRKTAELQQIEELYLKEAREKQMQLKERYQSHTQKLSAKVKEAELKHRLAEEELRKREKEQEELKMQLHVYQKEIHSFVSKTNEKLNLCEHKKHLQIPTNERIANFTKLLQDINIAVEESRTKNIKIQDLMDAHALLDASQLLLQNVMNDIDQARHKAMQESEKQQIRLQSRSEESIHANKTNLFLSSSPASIKKEIADNKTVELGKQQIMPNSLTKQNTVKEISLQESEVTHSSELITNESMEEGNEITSERELLSLNIDPEVCHEYFEVMENLKKWETSCLPFTADVKYKKYRFELQKAVNTPINAISDSSGDHLKDKMNRLFALLSGQSVEVSGKHISCRQDPLAIDYCKYIIAKQFVNQGGGQVASRSATAFPIAAVAVGICTKYPDIWKLILGHFYTKCPYLVPYYPARQEDQSEEDYYTTLGYVHNDDVIEDQDKFLKRMSGFVRLYAAIIQSSPPPGCQSTQPQGIELGWHWMARMLNMNPRSGITATLLFDFLDVAGHVLEKTYGKQLKKLLHVLCKDYFPKIKQVTPSGSVGPVMRLEGFLQTIVKKGRISPPDGVLSSNFWKIRSYN